MGRKMGRVSSSLGMHGRSASPADTRCAHDPGCAWRDDGHSGAGCPDRRGGLRPATLPQRSAVLSPGERGQIFDASWNLGLSRRALVLDVVVLDSRVMRRLQDRRQVELAVSQSDIVLLGRSTSEVSHDTSAKVLEMHEAETCLLYTSDAADEEDSVDL